MNNINIAISASKEYLPYSKVMMSSLIKLHPKTNINFFVFYLDSTVSNFKNEFLKIVKSNNQKNEIKFIKVEYDQVKLVDNNKGWAIDLWARWYR